MATTERVIITKDWVKVSDAQCEVQSVNDRDAYDKIYFDLIVSDTAPSADADIFMRITLSEHANFHRPTPVWLRLNSKNTETDQPVIVIK